MNELLESIATVVAMVILAIIAFVLSIIVYIRYAHGNNGEPNRQSWDWRRFFKFDVIILSGVMEYLYILFALETLAIGLAIIIGSITDGFFNFLVTLIVALVCMALVEVLVRISFELTMVFVKLAENTKSIKQILACDGGGVPAGISSVEGGTQTGALNATFFSQKTTDSSTTQGVSGNGDEWTCNNCGKIQTGGKFCGSCGAQRS